MELLLEEYGREIIHIKGINNMVADAISCLDYSPTPSDREIWMTITQNWCDYASYTTSQQPVIHQDSMNLVFANCSEKVAIYPLMVQEMVEAQQNGQHLQQLKCAGGFTTQLGENIQILCKDTSMVLPTAIQDQAISWYNHSL